MPVTTSLLSPAVPFFFLELQSRDSHLLVLWFFISAPFLGFWALLLWIPPHGIMLFFLYIVILNGGKGVSLGESFLDT